MPLSCLRPDTLSFVARVKRYGDMNTQYHSKTFFFSQRNVALESFREIFAIATNPLLFTPPSMASVAVRRLDEYWASTAIARYRLSRAGCASWVLYGELRAFYPKGLIGNGLAGLECLQGYETISFAHQI